MRSIAGYGIAINLNKMKEKDWTEDFLNHHANSTLIGSKIWLDDLRERPNRSFIHLKNYNEFKDFISTHGLPNFISFDQDLGLGKTGYDGAKFLVEYCLDNNLELPDYKVHSQNPVGKENIEKLLENIKKNQK